VALDQLALSLGRAIEPLMIAGPTDRAPHPWAAGHSGCEMEFWP
jgi:hypothetical protein